MTKHTKYKICVFASEIRCNISPDWVLLKLFIRIERIYISKHDTFILSSSKFTLSKNDLIIIFSECVNHVHFHSLYRVFHSEYNSCYSYHFICRTFRDNIVPKIFHTNSVALDWSSHIEPYHNTLFLFVAEFFYFETFRTNSIYYIFNRCYSLLLYGSDYSVNVEWHINKIQFSNGTNWYNVLYYHIICAMWANKDGIPPTFYAYCIGNIFCLLFKSICWHFHSNIKSPLLWNGVCVEYLQVCTHKTISMNQRFRTISIAE